MTILRTHRHDGTIGTVPTAAGEGYNVLTGAPTYVAGGVTSNACIRYATGTMFLQDNLTASHARLFVRNPATPTGDTSFLRTTDATGATSLSSIRMTSSGAITLYSTLATLVDSSAPGLITAGAWYRIEQRVSGATQEVRIYDMAAVLLDTLTGAAPAGTVGRWLVGHAHTAQSASATDIDEVAIGDDWIGGLPTTPADRTLSVGQRSRELAIEAADRTLTVPAAPRTTGA